MNKLPSSSNVAVSATERTSVPLTGTTLTTLDFGILRPVHFWDLMPNSKINGDLSVFTRLLPMQMPALGSAEVVTKLFWCPYRVAWPLFDDYMKNRQQIRLGHTLYTTGLPFVTNSALVDIFIANISDYSVSDEQSRDKLLAPAGTSQYYDVRFSDTDKTARDLDANDYQFTPKGRELYSFLLGLGYNINWNLADTTQMSALPLVSYARVFYDNILNPLRQDLRYFEQFFNPTNSTGIYDYTEKVLTLFEAVRFAFFDNDYFTSAWTSVDGVDVNLSNLNNAEYSSLASKSTILNVVYPFYDDSGDETSVSLRGLLLNDNNTGPVLNPHDLEFLEHLWKYLRSANLAGTMGANQILQKFGIKPSYFDAVRSHVISSSRSPIQISDVMATANGDSATGDSSVLGQYAGKGISYTDGSKFSVETNGDYGCIIAVSTVVPNQMYYQGRKRYLFHRDKFDFFQPDFDNMVGQPIRNDELFASYNSGFDYADGQNYGGKPDGVFGFSPRYSEYKIGNDFMLGDFRLGRMSNSLTPMQMFREVQKPRLGSPLSNNLDFQRVGRQDRIAYDRIFYWQTDQAEHFICNFMFNVHASIPAKSITDSQIPEMDEDKKKVSLNTGIKNF